MFLNRIKKTSKNKIPDIIPLASLILPITQFADLARKLLPSKSPNPSPITIAPRVGTKK